MENRKNTILLTVIAIATLLVAVIGATFAYFTAQGGLSVTRSVTVKTETADSTSFTIDRNITLTANQDNFGNVAEQIANDLISDPATGVAKFTASTGASASMCYTLELSVTANDFDYTTDPEDPLTSTGPELTLTVTRATVTDANDPDSLTYGTAVTVLDALDITTLNQTIYVPETAQTSISAINSRSIACSTFDRTNVHMLTASAGKTTAHRYVATIKLDNKNYDQQAITDKTFTGTLRFTSLPCTTPTQSCS